MKKLGLYISCTTALLFTLWWTVTASRDRDGGVSGPSHSSSETNVTPDQPVDTRDTRSQDQHLPTLTDPSSATPHPPAMVFGLNGPVSLRDVPAGKFHDQLAGLSEATRKRALRKLEDLRVPLNDSRSLNVDRAGRLYYECEPPKPDPDAMNYEDDVDALGTFAPAGLPQAAPVPIASPPVRHSRLGATKVIYLDFNGHTITGTAWNSNDPTAPSYTYYAKPLDFDGSPTTFSDSEQSTIIRVWERVAEDFKPFDVDVTTEEPASFTPTTGRVLITYSVDQNGVSLPSLGAAGVAFLGVFGDEDYATTTSPALVYVDALSNRNDYIAEVVSHEMGHNLSLSHDGTATQEYYSGHGLYYYYDETSWGPIMGTGYDRHVSQWSKGEYYNANNTQDDMALMAVLLGTVTDDHADSNGAALALTLTGQTLTGQGVIGANGDGDRFAFTVGLSSVNFSVIPFRSLGGYTYGGNLDVRVQVYDVADQLLATSEGNDTGTTSVNLAVGLPAGTYYVRVSATGAGNPTVASPTGYTDYASLGEYTITGTISTPVAPAITSNPYQATVYAGQAAYFSAYASGQPSPSYQWQRLPAAGGAWTDISNGGPFSYDGATSSSLVINIPTTALNGDQFRCVAINIAGSATSTSALLAVNPAVAPQVYNLPAAIYVNYGESFSFYPAISGTPTITYQWKKDGVDLAGATSYYYSKSGATTADSGAYTLTATNYAGTSTSAVVAVTVNPAVTPAIHNLPALAIVNQGDSVYLSPTITGTQPMTYQWKKDGVNLSGATSSYYSKSGATTADNGVYTLSATNLVGTVSSSEVTVTVNPAVAPVIYNLPAGVTVNYGESLYFSPSVTGTQPMTYQWKKDGVNLSGATSSYYSKSGLTPTDSGIYTLTATNVTGTITSSEVTVTVNPAAPPTIYNLPAAVLINYGETLYFSPTVIGTNPIAFQWKKGGVNLAGATSSYYQKSGMTTADSGVYTLTATNSVGAVTSSEVTVTVNPAVAPLIYNLPTSVTIRYGESLYLSPAVSGTQPITLQWKKNEVNVAGATSSSYSKSNTSTTDSGSYTLTATNVAGTVTSATITVTVSAAIAPAIFNLPAATTVKAGESLYLAPTVTGTQPMTYQWKKNGVNVAGATSSSFSKYNVTTADSGTYTLIATNTAGTVTSSEVAVTVQTPVAPAIYNLPVALSVNYGESFYFSPGVSGTQPMTYQWKKNGVNVAGATSSSFSKYNVTTADSGTYTLIATNTAGTVTSSEVAVTVQPAVAPAIYNMPGSVTVNYASSISIYPSVVGTQPMSYQWRKDGVDIAGAMSSSYYQSYATTADSGVYTLTVTNVAGTTTSTDVTVLVNPAIAPTISQQPAPLTVTAGAKVSFSVTAAGTSPLAYQWYLNGEMVSGGTNSTLNLANVQAANAGDYTVQITNPGGTITSDPAALTILSNAGIIFATGGESHSLFVRSDASLWATGYNGWGQLGDGTTNDKPSPILVDTEVVAAAAGARHSLFIKADGSLWAMGYNYYGQLGDGTTTQRNDPVQIATGVAAVAAGSDHSFFIKTDGSLWAMGRNTYGQLGDGTNTQRSTPILIATGVVKASAGGEHSLFIKADGSLWAMGYNYYGQLGDGTTTQRYTPVQVATEVESAEASNDSSSYFIKADGVLWAMGYNYSGQLGDGTTTVRTTPVQITTGVTAVSAGSAHAMFLKSNGDLWTTGYNGYGQLGDGSYTSRLTPGLSASGIVAISTGNYYTHYMTPNGGLWATGNGYSGQLGDGTAYSYINVPVLVMSGPMTAPAAPTDVQGSYVTALNAMRLIWDPSLGASSYEVWRNSSDDSGSAVLIASNVTKALYFDATVAAGQTYYYWVRAKNPAGASALSSNGSVVGGLPVISTHPVSQAKAAGQSATFTVAADGVGPLTYQWQMGDGETWQDIHDNAEWWGTATTTLTIADWAVLALNGIQFRCIVTNSSGSITSNTATLTICAPSGDFDGDGQSEIVWQNSISGDRYMWFLNGTTMTSANYLTTLPPADWNIAANGDFNGDGKSDLVWHSPNSGDSYIWYMDGVSKISAHYLTNRATAWKIAAAGDFNDDGKSDLVWQNFASGERQIWLMDGLTMASTVHLTTIETGWSIAGSGDFNGDGNSDLLWQHTNGDRYMWLMDGTSLSQAKYLTTIETGWSIAGSGDFNDDGKSDIIWQHSGSGDRYIWTMDGGTLIQAKYFGTAPTDWSIVNH